MIILFALLSFNLFANIGEHFGASSETIALSGQSNFDASDAVNSFYIPAILADDMRTSYSYSEIAVQTNFKKINNIVTSSPINSGDTFDSYGSVDTSEDMQFFRTFHGSFPFIKALKAKLNISIFLPSTKFLEARTGDPYRPEYVMYTSRFNRTMGYVSYAQKLEQFNFSVGFLTGIQSNGETFIVAKDNGSQTPSSGKMQFNAKPSAAFNFSLSKKWKWGLSYFSFQDEMKSKFENTARGFTPVGATINYNWDLSSMLFYDPTIIRLGHRFENFIATLEYQDWSGYKAPILQMQAGDSSTLVSSSLEENYNTSSIFIPKVGYIFREFSFGLSYKPSPLNLKSGSSGNSVDTAITTTSFGYKKTFSLFEQALTFKSGLTYHFLETKTVTKDEKRENGTLGNKIGYPSYEIGGNVYALSIGLSWVI